MPQAVAAKRAGLYAALGGLLGLVLGAVVDGAIWLWAFASALNGDGPTSFGPIVEVSGSADAVTAVGGPGLLILPLGVALLGAVGAGLAARRRGARRTVAPLG